MAPEGTLDVSWAAHEFENYFIQKKVGTKASFLAIVVGTQAPDLFTKYIKLKICVNFNLQF